MQSIIEEIASAEAQAETIRQEAVLSARENALSAKADAEKKLSALERAEQDAFRTATFEAEQRGEMLSKKTLAEMSAAADAECDKAFARIPAAIDYLMEKVRNLA